MKLSIRYNVRQLSKNIALALALALAAAGCGTADEPAATLAPGLEGVAYEGVRVVAEVTRPNGGVVHFLASETADGAGCGELVPLAGASDPASAATDARDCLQLFIDLTAADVPVPEVLVMSSERADAAGLVANRRIVDRLDQAVRSIEPERTRDPGPFAGDQSTTPHSCTGNAGSQAHFEAEHCDFSGGSGVIHYCDSGMWADLIRTTAGATRENSFEEALVCTPLADVIHEYWNGTSWPNVYTITNIPGDYYHWSRWQGAAAWQRRIHVSRVFASGFFRSHSIFYN